MRYKLSALIFLCMLAFVSSATAQRAEVAVTLNEAFFNALLDSVFTNFDAPEFPIAQIKRTKPADPARSVSSFGFAESRRELPQNAPCGQTVKILRESGGVRTSVRIRDGRISFPLAFSGTYSPPFVGCVEFSGWADSFIDLEFDREGQRLVGHVTVSSVNLNGTGGVGGTLIAKMLQGSLDQKMNPLEIFRLDKLSFVVPMQNVGNLRLRALAARPELSTGSLTVHIDYDFLKG
jgi:hypothetical protein